MKNSFPFIILLILLASCNNQKANKELANTMPDLSTNINTDTLFVRGRVAVFFEPDTLRIEKRKKEIGDQDFNTGAGDYLYYMHLSREFIDSVKLPILNTKNKKFIKFISNDSSKQLVIIDTLPELWGVYFFEPSKKSKQVDIISIAEEYSKYFQH
jgi:hypothetical protein